MRQDLIVGASPEASSAIRSASCVARNSLSGSCDRGNLATSADREEGDGRRRKVRAFQFRPFVSSLPDRPELNRDSTHIGIGQEIGSQYFQLALSVSELESDGCCQPLARVFQDLIQPPTKLLPLIRVNGTPQIGPGEVFRRPAQKRPGRDVGIPNGAVGSYQRKSIIVSFNQRAKEHADCPLLAREPFGLVDVGAGAIPPDDIAIAIPDRFSSNQKPPVFAIVPAKSLFDLVRGARPNCGSPGSKGFGQVGGMNHPAPIPSE